MKTNVRLNHVDLLRALALIVMIEVHVFNETLMEGVKLAWHFKIINFINGLVAPTFIFISGYAFSLASARKLESFRKFSFDFWKQAGRIALIFAAGYSLRLPAVSLNDWIYYSSENAIKNFYKVDVLQCIAVGLGIIFIVRLIIKSDVFYEMFLLIAGIIIVLVSPIMWEYNFVETMPLYLANYINTKNGSFFPLFPWLGFMFLGSYLSALYLKNAALGKTDEHLKRLVKWGGALIAVFIFIKITPVSFINALDFMRPSYFFFALRFGLVIMLLYLCKELGEKINMDGSVILTAGKESLLVYWLHLKFLYMPIYNGESVSKLYSQKFGYIEASVATIILLIIMLTLAKGWNTLKANNQKLSKILFWSAVGVFMIYFSLKGFIF